MEGSIENYKKIHSVILYGFILVSALLLVTSLRAVESYVTMQIGAYSFYILKIVPWGGFGSLMKCAFLSAKDKDQNYKRKAALEANPKGEKPYYPDSNDVVMYGFYVLSGLVLAALSAFFLETGIDYVGTDQTLPIRDRYGLFAIFAFYAGYSQSELVGRLTRRASEQ